jgi:hypothetical protein
MPRLLLLLLVVLKTPLATLLCGCVVGELWRCAGGCAWQCSPQGFCSSKEHKPSTRVLSVVGQLLLLLVLLRLRVLLLGGPLRGRDAGRRQACHPSVVPAHSKVEWRCGAGAFCSLLLSWRCQVQAAGPIRTLLRLLWLRGPG